MWWRYVTFFFLFGAATGASENPEEQLLDRLLLEELRQSSDGLFPPSWAYSNEGGVIKYAEVDLIGDERSEVIYSRSIQGSIGGSGEWSYEIYFQPFGEEQFVRLEGKVFLGNFHKKEAGKALFLHATEGRNFATDSEQAFTKKLIIQEASPEGVENQTHLIDDESNPDLVRMWQAALFEHDEASASVMEGLGFSVKNPNYKWISLKDYLLGKEWEDYVASDWSALTEFETEGMSWPVPKDLVSPSFLDFARQVRELQNPNVFGIPWEAIEFPDGYLSPKEAYRLILERTGRDSGSDANREEEAESRKPSHQAVNEEKATSTAHIEREQETAQSNQSTGLAWIFAGVVLLLILVLFLRAFMRGRAS